jgi:hypothetical protein
MTTTTTATYDALTIDRGWLLLGGNDGNVLDVRLDAITALVWAEDSPTAWTIVAAGMRHECRFPDMDTTAEYHATLSVALRGDRETQP